MATNKSVIQARYDSKHCKMYALKFNLESDADIIEQLSSVPNVQGYIRQAIRAYMASTRSESAPETEKQ